MGLESALAQLDDVVVCVTTAPRRTDDGADCDYLQMTLDNLQRVGWPSQIPWHVVCDGGRTIAAGAAAQRGCRVSETPRRLGVYGAWRFAAEMLLTQYGPERCFLLLQDDVDFCDQIVGYVPQAMVQTARTCDVGCFSLYTSPAMVSPQHRSAHGFVPAALDRHSFWGALALLFPPYKLAALLATNRFIQHSHSARLDVVVGNALTNDLGAPIYVHVPSLVEHRGAWSTIGRHRIKSIQTNRRGYQFERAARLG